MRTVDDFAEIRRLHANKLSIRAIALRLGVGRATVRKAIANPEPVPYTLAAPRPAPTFGPFRAIADDILAADRTAPPKQRHTATQIFRRLVAEHHYAGGYDQVRRYLKQQRLDRRETFIPLAHPPGHRAEADFGHIHVDFPDGRRLVPVLVVTWSYSNCPFALALPTERTEAVLHGLVEAFTFFGCVPRELWWDNPKTVAVHIFKGRDRTPHARYAALASHYTFAPRFCMPAAPTEKPRVEKRVQDLERQWATPVPRVDDLDQLNAHLRRQYLAARDRTCGDNALSVAALFEHDRAAGPGAPVRRVRDPTGPGGQVPDRAVRPQLLQRAAPVGVPRGERQGVRGPRRGGRRWGHDRRARPQLRARAEGPRPAPLPGGSGAQARRPGSRAGVPRLATAGRVHRAARRPRGSARVERRRAALHPRVAVAREPPGRAPGARHRGVPVAQRTRRHDHHGRRPTAPLRRRAVAH